MKKIALASAAMGGVALFAFGASGTFASFTDTERTQTLEAKASTMDLKVGTTASSPAAALKFTPGAASQKFAYFATNGGDVTGALSADLVLTGNAENECKEPELGVDGSCAVADDAWAGELAGQLMTTAYKPVVTTEADCDAADGVEVAVAARSLWAASNAPVDSLGDLASGAGLCFVYEFELPTTATNAVQSDSATFRVDLNLAQKVQ